MTKTDIPVNELLDAVCEAAEAVMKIYNARSAVAVTKADTSPVTQADIAAHRILSSRIRQLYPDAPVVSEEGDEQENRQSVTQRRFWLIDPLDGTKEFLAGTGDFTVCVALIDGDIPYFGIVAAPALQITYFGGPGFGSFKQIGNGKPVPIRVARGITNVVLGSRYHINQETGSYIQKHYPGHEVKAVGSQLKLTQIAEGLADACPRLNHTMHLWDLAAGHAILTGAGGTVRRPDGRPIDYHATGLLVGDFVAESISRAAP